MADPSMESESEENLEQTQEETDEQLLAELQREELAKAEALAQNATNTTLNGTAKAEPEIGTQLSPFQEQIITTGSEVSVMLLLILGVLFIIQAIRRLYSSYHTNKELSKVEDVTEELKPQAAQDFYLEPDLDPLTYPVYNTEMPERDTFYEKMKEGVPNSVLKDLLLKRAVKCIGRIAVLQRDSAGIRKNWQQDLLPKDVWEDFQSAQSNVQAEIAMIQRENEQMQFDWGPYGKDIFAEARDRFRKEQQIRQQVMFRKHQQKMQQQGRQQGGAPGTIPGVPTPPGISNGPPDASKFGRGFGSGFLQGGQGPAEPGPKLSHKERKEQRKRQKEEAKQLKKEQMARNPHGSSTTNALGDNKPRQRKPKHKFSGK